VGFLGVEGKRGNRDGSGGPLSLAGPAGEELNRIACPEWWSPLQSVTTVENDFRPGCRFTRVCLCQSRFQQRSVIESLARYIPIDGASESESSASSRLASPQDHSRRESEHPSQVHGGMYPQLHGQEHAGHKRKGSGSDDPMAYAEQRPYEYSLFRKPGPQHMANRAMHVLESSGHDAAPDYQNGAEQHNGHTWHSERPIQSHPPVNGIRPNTSEAQMVEVLPRDANVSEAQPRPWEPQPITNGQTTDDQYSHEAVTGVTALAPKRKRNFSNRTKTGCLTCRTRKKKCDEAQPVCEFR
jgi:hypothetical protein